MRASILCLLSFHVSLFAAACGGAPPPASPADAASAPAAASDVPAPAAAPAAGAPSAPAPSAGAKEEDGWAGEKEAKEAKPGDKGAAPAAPGTGPDPKPKAGSDKVVETRTLEVITKIIQDNRKAVRECYDKARKDLPTLQGDMVIHFVLDPEGAVKVADLNQEKSSLKSPAVVDCTIKVIKALKFPKSSRAMETTTNYPFHFTPGG